MAHAPAAHPPSSPPSDLVTLSVPIGRRCCAGCVELVARRLRENPNVARVRVDAPHELAHVEVRPGTVTVEELAGVAGESCGGRCPVLMPDAVVSSHDHAHTADPARGADAPEAHAMEHAEH